MGNLMHLLGTFPERSKMGNKSNFILKKFPKSKSLFHHLLLPRNLY
jgi:hypothetical protein